MDFCSVAENAGLPSSDSKKIVKIGVLGGIGPEATSEFYSRLIKELQKRNLIKRNADYPQIIINSIPAPELVFEKITDKDLKAYIDGVKFLDRCGVDFIVMVCNTIHIYYDKLQKAAKTPIFDLRKEVRKALKKQKRALLLGTPGTIGSGLYKFGGIRYQKLTRKERSDISDSILVFNKGGCSKAPARICKKYSRSNQIVLACTELSLMLEKESVCKTPEGRQSVVSTLDILVDATVDRFQSLKSKNSFSTEWNSGCKLSLIHI